MRCNMATTNCNSSVKAALEIAINNNEYDDIKTMLAEHLPLHATWKEQVEVTIDLGRMINGALFSYTPTEGWTYVEEGA